MQPVRGPHRRVTPQKGNFGKYKDDPEMLEIMKMIGTNIHDKYCIASLLGKGGMGVVYLAKVLKDDPKNDLKKGDEVAVKIISQRITDPRMIERFNREVKATVMIDHPNVIDIIEINTFGNKKFCVMEVLRGVDLDKVLKTEGPLPWETAKSIILQVCAGVNAAHMATADKPPIIHRDLKPSNIFLIRQGGDDQVKVIDFGLAKFLEDQPSELTQEGFIVGTPSYLAPEQTFGKHDYDHRVDIYAMGVIMYKTLAGKVPFDSKDTLELLNMIRSQPPRPPRELNPKIPKEVESIILKALSKRLEQRYQTMDEMIEAIELTGGPAQYKGSVVSDDLLLQEMVRDSEAPKTPDEDLHLDSSSLMFKESPPPESSRGAETEILALRPRDRPPAKKSSAFGTFAKAALVIGAVSGVGYVGFKYKDRYMPYVERVSQQDEQPSSQPTASVAPESSFMASISGTPGAYVYEVSTPTSRERNHLGNIPARGGGPFNYRFSDGEHILVVSKPGYVQETVRVRPSDPSVQVTLSPRVRGGRARPDSPGEIQVGEPEVQE